MTDIFSPFYEENVDLRAQVRAILVREKMKLPPLEAGMTRPFIPLDGCSGTEKEMIKQFIDTQGGEALQELVAQVTLGPAQSQNCLSPASFAGIFHDLKVLMSRGRKKSQEFSPYDAMMAVLERMRLVYYDNSFYVQKEAVFRSISEADLRTAIFAILEPMIAAGKNHKIVNSAVEALKMNGNIHAAKTSEDSDRVFFLNGAYSISQRQCAPILPTDFFTTYIPLYYSHQPGGCPYFEQYLEQVSGGDESIKRLIWEMIGYLLVPDMAAKVFFVLQGVGDSGKSLLGNLISSLFNPEAVSHMDSTDSVTASPLAA